MAQDRVIFGMVERVEDLLMRQADVHCVLRSPHHRNGEEALQIARGVPVHHGDRLARAKPLRDQKRTQSCNPVVKNAVGPRLTVAIDNQLIRTASGRSLQDLPEVQGEVSVHWWLS
jgi:hypothetical protein